MSWVQGQSQHPLLVSGCLPLAGPHQPFLFSDKHSSGPLPGVHGVRTDIHTAPFLII